MPQQSPSEAAPLSTSNCTPRNLNTQPQPLAAAQTEQIQDLETAVEVAKERAKVAEDSFQEAVAAASARKAAALEEAGKYREAGEELDGDDSRLLGA